ncbi:MAG: hypothetical protein ACM3SW_14545 [Actinomycetota bacterium]
MSSPSPASPERGTAPADSGAIDAPPARKAKDPEPGLTRQDYIEQYKAYLADLGNIGIRYTTLQGFYVSVISGLMGILALTESPKLLGRIPVSTMGIACAFSSALCVLWFLTIRYYRKLFLAKITVLKKLEEYLPLNCFDLEWAVLIEPATKPGKESAKKEGPAWLKIEQFIPFLLIVFFVILFFARKYA